MTASATNKENLEKEFAAYRKVYRAVFWAYYVSVGLLFIFLCRQVGGEVSQGFAAAGWFAVVEEIGAVAAIWYLFYLCDTGGGLLKLLRMWEKSLLQRQQQEETIDALRTGGLYFVDDTEMVLLDDKYIVPKDRVK